MSDDEQPGPSLRTLLRKSPSLDGRSAPLAPTTDVLLSAEYIYDNSIDVAIDASSTKLAAATIHSLMQEKQYSTRSWSAHDLHPKPEDGEKTLNFIFTMDLLNFSFWSERAEDERYAVQYRGRRWTGYWSLVACLQRALDEGIPITDAHFWENEEECSQEVFQHIFRSDTAEPMPMLRERLNCLREAGEVLYAKWRCGFTNIIAAANRSAVTLVNLLVRDFPCLRDEHVFEGRTVHIYKRAQILVADIWACFNGSSYGAFHDIDTITMFADYRIPQMLHTLGCMTYSPSLERRIRRQEEIKSGETCELELRGCSIWAVELIRRQIVTSHAEAKVNSVLIDFLLYDTLKQREKEGELTDMIPHHRTRSIWY